MNKPHIRKKGSWWVCYMPLERADPYWPTDRTSGVGLTPLAAYQSRERSIQDLELFAARLMDRAFRR